MGASKARRLFADSLSLRTFDAVSDFWERNEKQGVYDTSGLAKIKQDIKDIYFPFKFTNKEVFVDGGGYDGDTAAEFIKRFGYKHIHIFEPDKDLLGLARTRLQDYKNISFHPLGLYSSSKTLKFKAEGNGGGHLSDSGVETGAIALDQIVDDATFIKLDIEGAEIDALKGATAHIKRGARLAVCVYHNPSHLYEVPLYIHSVNPRYKFSIRHYSDTHLETVVYAEE